VRCEAWLAGGGGPARLHPRQKISSVACEQRWSCSSDQDCEALKVVGEFNSEVRVMDEWEG